MLKTATVLGALALLALPATLMADSPSLMTKRANSCGGSAFEQTFAEGKHEGYRHRRFNILGPTYVGEAILEWCQSAQNAVIYFYVDDPGRKDHDTCPEAMSLAVFPGRGPDVPQILKDNMLSYDDPQVKVLEAPRVEPIKLTIGDRTIDALQMEGALIDSAGRPTRKKMIGYDKDGDFIRVMTGVVDGKGCTNDVTANFMASMKWP